MPKTESKFEFQFRGWNDGWYVLRADIGKPHKPLAAHAFQNQVLEWLIEQGITPNSHSYLTNGNTGDGPNVPVASDGSQLCLLFKRPTDVIRFEMAFPCRDITPKSLMNAIRAEASVHKLILSDIAIIAYGAARQLGIILGEKVPEWDQLDNDMQQLHIQMVQDYYLQIPNWTPERLHKTWVDLRLKEGWRYDIDINIDKRKHPFLVPFIKLSVNDQMKFRLFAHVVASMAPSL